MRNQQISIGHADSTPPAPNGILQPWQCKTTAANDADPAQPAHVPDPKQHFAALMV